MSEPPLELAEVQDAVLDAETLTRLFADLGAFAKVLEVRVKHRPNASSSSAQLGLNDLHAALQSGAAQSGQIRYEYRGKLWIDTFMWSSGGVRLVRFQPPWA